MPNHTITESWKSSGPSVPAPVTLTDVAELAPLIEAFRLPPDQALDIFKAWKGINFYSFQYVRVQPQLIDLTKWLNTIVIPHGAMPGEQRAKLIATIAAVRDQLRREWQTIEAVLREYADGYDQRRYPETGVWAVAASFDDYAQLVSSWRDVLPDVSVPAHDGAPFVLVENGSAPLAFTHPHGDWVRWLA